MTFFASCCNYFLCWDRRVTVGVNLYGCYLDSITFSVVKSSVQYNMGRLILDPNKHLCCFSALCANLWASFTKIKQLMKNHYRMCFQEYICKWLSHWKIINVVCYFGNRHVTVVYPTYWKLINYYEGSHQNEIKI